MSSRSLHRDDSGAVAIWVAATLAAMIGIVALSLDLGRMATADSELKWASDAAALAGARQLDGNAGAMTRATSAAMGAAGVGLTGNGDSFDDDAGDVKVASVKFLSKLGPGDGTGGDVVATSDADARFITVVVEQTTVDNLFAQVVGGADTSTVQQASTAGYGSTICQVTPLMVCNPAETSTSKDVVMPAGMGVLLKAGGGGSAQWGPGNYGLLKVPGLPGKDSSRDAFAAQNGSPVCFDPRLVETEPGDPVSVNAGLNVRLDIYKSPLKPNEAWIGVPAKNVVSGWASIKNPDTDCNPGLNDVTDTYTGPGDTSAQLMTYPRDKCFYGATPTCTRFGTAPYDGTHWDKDLYCQVNHSGGPCPTSPTGKETNTRYGVYRAEIEANQIPNNALDPGKAGSDAPKSCYKSEPSANIPAGTDMRDVGLDPSTQYDRRVITSAVVNCLDQEDNLKGRKNVKVVKWLLMFMTEPAGYVDNQDIFLEVIREIDMNLDETYAHDIVQLYR
jgi:hypothetical protein